MGDFIYLHTIYFIESKDLVVSDKYEYILWSINVNMTRVIYKLHYHKNLDPHLVKSMNHVLAEDYDLVETHYQYLKLKYG
jgi:hypothetical protein